MAERTGGERGREAAEERRRRPAVAGFPFSSVLFSTGAVNVRSAGPKPRADNFSALADNFFGERARDGNKATCGNEILKSTEAICLCSRCASSRSLLSDGGARSMQFPTWLAGPAQYQARCTYRRIAAASGLRSLLVLSIGKLVPKSLHLSRLLLSINWQTTCI